MRHGIIFIYILMFLPGLAFSQNSRKASVNGFIKDKKSGKILHTAQVILKGTHIGASANKSGYYSINDIKPGSYTLVYSYIGYKRRQLSLNLKPDQQIRLDINLVPEHLRLKELTVNSERQKNEEKDIGVTQISSKMIFEKPFVQPDVLRALEYLPGIQSSSGFSTGIYIRGGSPDQTLISLDGTTVYNPTHFLGFISTFNPDAVNNVKVYKGGYPAKLGDRIGSVVDIHYKDGNNRPENVVSLGLLSSRIALEGGFKKGSYILAFRHSNLGPEFKLIKKYDSDIPQYVNFWDFNGKVTLNPDNSNKLSLTYYSSNDNLKNTLDDLSNLYLCHGNNTGSLKWTHIYSSKVFSNFLATGNYYYNSPRIYEAGTSFKRSNPIKEFKLKGNIEIIPNSHHDIAIGGVAGLINISLKNYYLQKLSYSSNTDNLFTDWYMQDTWHPTEHWKIELGLRSNYYSSGKYFRLSPRGMIEYKPAPYLQFQGAVGIYQQFISLSETNSINGLNIWQSTSDGVAPMSGKQYLFGIKAEPFNTFTVDIESYYRNMLHLFELNPMIPDYSGLSYQQLFQFGKGYAYGLEVTLRKKTKHLYAMAGYSYSISMRKFPDMNNDEYYPSNYNRTNTLNISANYQINHHWAFNAMFSYASGQPYSGLDGLTRITHSPLSSIVRQILVINHINDSNLPDYDRLDIGITHESNFFNIGKAEIRFQIINVLSHRNIWFYKYNFTSDHMTVESMQMLPILPSLSYTIKW